ncbi:MAG: M23 family metallopeptidase [Thermomicrobiales bacterium]
MFAPSGSLVVAIEGGRVQDAGPNTLGGNAVYISGDDGLDYYYAHFRDLPLVHVGDIVTPSQAIGYVGNTGDAAATAPHLHIGIGHGIATGSGAHGGAGENFDAVAFLRAIYNGQQPVSGVVNASEQSGNTGGGNPVTAGISAATGFLSILTGILRWLASLVTG